MPPGGLDSLLDHPGGALRKAGEDAAGVEPAHADLTEDAVPVDVAASQLARRGVTTIGHPERSPNAEATFGEVQAVAAGTTDTIERQPADEGRVDASLEDAILHETTDLVVDERGDKRGAQPEAAPKTARHVVLTASRPDGAAPSGTDSHLARIQPKHHLSERKLIEAAFPSGSHGQVGHARLCRPFRRHGSPCGPERPRPRSGW